MRNRRSARRVGVLASFIVCCAAGTATVSSADDESLTVFLTFPMINGFSDATHSLVEAKELIREPLSAAPELRLVDRPEDADVVITVLGRGKGDVELTAALRTLHRTIVAPPVPIAGTERYIEVLLTTGSCRTMAITVEEASPESCYRRVFVGVGLSELDAQQRTKKRRLNSWEACAEALVRDVQAWLTTNAERLRAHRPTASR